MQSTILIAWLMVYNENALLGLGLVLSATEIPHIAQAFGLDTTTRANIAVIDVVVAEIGGECEWESELDVIRVKSVFYSLFFGSDFPRSHSNRAFVDCFVEYETRFMPAKGI